MTYKTISYDKEQFEIEMNGTEFIHMNSQEKQPNL